MTKARHMEVELGLEVVAEFHPSLGDDLFLVEMRKDGKWQPLHEDAKTYSLQRALAVAEYVASPVCPVRVLRFKTTAEFAFPADEQDAKPDAGKVAP